jgi:hypothetical protein
MDTQKNNVSKKSKTMSNLKWKEYTIELDILLVLEATLEDNGWRLAKA